VTRVEAPGPCWKPHLRALERIELALLYWGSAPGLELQLFANVIDEAIRCDEEGRLRRSWIRWEDGLAMRFADIYVLQQDPSRTTVAAQLLSPQIRDALILIGPAARWFAKTPPARGRRVALHWEDCVSRECALDSVVASSSIIEVSDCWTTCAGGLAVVDLALQLVQELAGARVALQAMEALCLDRMRGPESRQRAAVSEAFGALVPPLQQAIALMQANIEEPMDADELARRVGVSRRHLERLFKQHLSVAPSRHYLAIRLQRARTLLCETRHSSLQIALMCGFSSGSHFSTAYSAVFGIAPREERQRALSTLARVPAATLQPAPRAAHPPSPRSAPMPLDA